MPAPSPLALLGADYRRFDPGVALALGELAALAYAEGGTVTATARRAGWIDDTSISTGATQAAIYSHPSAIVAAIRGSDNRADWRYNLASIIRRPWKDYIPEDCWVGWGWRRQAETMLPELIQAINTAAAEFPDAPLYLVGHSAGAAIETILAPALERAHYTPRLIVTFSSPRPGGKQFSGWYDTRFPQTWRIVPIGRRGEQDVVTRVPRSSWPVRAWHVGQPKILARRGDGTVAVYESERAWDLVRSETRVGWWRSLRVGSRLAAGVGAHTLAVALGMLRDMVEERDARGRVAGL